jgi:hypothetical protein
MSFSRAMNVSLALGVVLLAASAPIGHAVSAPNADVAKKCREMMIKAIPPLRAGTESGVMQQQREYFQSCVAQNGKMEDTTEGRSR